MGHYHGRSCAIAGVSTRPFSVQRQTKSYVVLSFVHFLLTVAVPLALEVFARKGAAGMLTGKLIAALMGFLLAVILVWNPLPPDFIGRMYARA